MDDIVTRLNEALESVETRLAKLNDAPNTQKAVGVDDQLNKKLDSVDMFQLRRDLSQYSFGELEFMFSKQAAKEGHGIPFRQWAAAGGRVAENAIAGNETLLKAIDTTGAAPLIRQDLEPLIYALFVKVFPAWERFAKEPANGLVHAYNQQTAYGDAQFMSELGTVTDDQNTYVRQTSNVSIIGTRRGISLKSQFAVQAGGMGYNPEQLELQGGLRAIAHKLQKTIFQGNASTASGAGASTELGAYDANGFTGLRSLLNSNRVVNVDPTAATPEDIRAAIDRACIPVMDAGGTVQSIYIRATDKTTFDLQQDKNVRYMGNLTSVAPGVLTNAVNTVFGPLPLIVIPGDSIGTYTATSTYSGNTVADVYVLDETTISMPYLGSDAPAVLEIPTGVSGQLTKMYILFGMWGLSVKAPGYSNKVRIKQA